MTHLHTKSANTDKITAALDAIVNLTHTPTELRTCLIQDIAELAREAKQALAELKDQTGIL